MQLWDALLVAARLLQFAAALVLLGSSLFRLYGLRSVAMPRRIEIAASMAAIGATVLWVMAETVLFSGDAADGTRPAAVWLVFSETRFGLVCLWRIGLLLLCIAASFRRGSSSITAAVQAVLASLVVATFAWTGHGAMDAGGSGAIHLAGDLLHLWFAGAWFGALVPLGILLIRATRSQSAADADAAHHGLSRFSALGVPIVAVLVVSGLVNSWFLVGVSRLQSAASTPYGTTLLIKLALFGMMLVLAAANRFWWVPRLRASLTSTAAERLRSLRVLRFSVLGETALALLILLAVGVLGTFEPPHIGE